MRTRHMLMASAIAAGVIASSLTTTTAASAAPGPISAPVNPYLVVQDDFQGFGTSLAWWADVVGGWSEPQRSQMLDLLFAKSASTPSGTVPGLSLDVVRYNVGASQPGVEYPVIDPHLPARNGAWIDSLIKADGTYDWTVDASQRKVLVDSIARGATTFELFANSAPWWMTYSGEPSGRYKRDSPETCQQTNLKPEYHDDFADYMATVAERFKNVGINGPGSTKVNFQTVEPFNEPGNGWWCLGNNQEGSYFSAADRSSIVSQLRAKLDARSLTGTGIAASDSNDYWGAIAEFDEMTPTAQSQLAQLNAHGYAGADAEPIRDRAEAGNRRFWQSEWGPAGWGGYNITSELDAGLELATRVTNDLSYVESNAWLYWQAVEDSTRGEGPGYWGLIQAPLDGSAQTYDLQKQFFTLGQYSRFIEPGYQIVDSGNGKTIAAVDPNSTKLVLVTYNDQAQSMPIAYNLSQFNTGSASVTATRTSATEDLANISAPAVSGGTLSATVPSNSVVTYVINNISPKATGVTAETINDSSGFEYSSGWNDTGYSGSGVGAYGLWDQDEHATQQAGATAEYSFHGTGIDLFGTLAPTSGKAAISIDGGAETTVDLSQNGRFDGSHIWSSPTLSAGRHTVKVRALGQGGAIGGGTWVNIDRAVVKDASWQLCASAGATCATGPLDEVLIVTNKADARRLSAPDVTCQISSFPGATGTASRCYKRDATDAALVVMGSEQCAGVAGGSTAVGAEVVQWTCSGQNDQRWLLTPSGSGYRLSAAHAPALCLGVSGALVKQTACSDPSATWNVTPVRDGYYELKPGTNTGVCLDVPGATKSKGVGLGVYTCNRYPNQLWRPATV